MVPGDLWRGEGSWFEAALPSPMGRGGGRKREGEREGKKEGERKEEGGGEGERESRFK